MARRRRPKDLVHADDLSERTLLFGPDSPMLPGTLVTVDGLGIVLAGGSGIGKSETALGLVARGHRLIADDAIVIMCADGKLYGSHPPRARGLLALRDLGIIDLARLYGDEAVAGMSAIDLIIELEPPSPAGPPAGGISPRRDTRPIQDVQVPRLRMHATAGRDLALLIEVAARDYRQRQQGYYADAALDEAVRQRLIEDAS